MVQDDRGQLFVTEACHHLGAVHWVTFDEIELRVGEPGRLIENLSWNAELADIVNQRGSANRLNLAAGETHLAGDASGIASHAIGVTPGVSILGFQRGRQSPEKFLLAVDRPSWDAHRYFARGRATQQRSPAVFLRASAATIPRQAVR